MRWLVRLLLGILIFFAVYGAVRLRSDVIAHRNASAALVKVDGWKNELLLRVPMEIDGSYPRVDSIRMISYFGCDCALEAEMTTRKLTTLVAGYYSGYSSPRVICTTEDDTVLPTQSYRSESDGGGHSVRK